MATTQSNAKTVSEVQTREIESDRLERALSERMTVEKAAPKMYEVTNGDDETRTVDIELGTCQCADYEYRGEAYYCKHVLRACVHAIFIDGVRTELQARVAGEVRALGCPYDHSSITDDAGCAGPLGRSTFPCPDCVGATPGSWSAWKFLMEDECVAVEDTNAAESTESTPEVACDGGTEPDAAGVTSEVSERIVAMNAENEQLADVIEQATGERPIKARRQTIRGGVEAKFPAISGSLKETLDDDFGVRTTQTGRHREERGDDVTVTTYQVAVLEPDEFGEGGR